MTPEALRAIRAELREAGAKLGRRPTRATVEALGRVLEGWRDAGSAWRSELAAQLPAATGFSPQTLQAGLELGLAAWSDEALRALVAHELGPIEPLDRPGRAIVSGFDTTAVLLAGSIPMPSLLSLLAPLVLGSPVLAKSASRDPVTPKLVARSIAETDADLGRCIRVVGFEGSDDECMAALLEADCIVASGSDATVASVRARVEPPRRLVTHGHALSVAALGAETTRGAKLADAARRVALDVALWDQLGCLSPQAVYAAGDAAATAEALATALAEIEARMPRGGIDPASAAAIAHERAEVELRRAAGARVELFTGPGSAWTVVREDVCALRPAPLHRFLRVFPVEDAAALLDALAPLGPHLAGVALEGFGAATPGLLPALAALGASRICRPGTLQAPPLGWPRGGRGVLTPLARLTDLELAL